MRVPAGSPAALLLRYLRPPADTGGAWADGPASAAGWDALAREARRQRVAPLLYRRLRDAGPPPAPAARFLAEVRRAYRQNGVRNWQVLDELARALAALRGAGVPAIPLKGAFLAEAVYADPAVRPLGDVDLLVRRADLGRAERVFRALGYAPDHVPGRDPPIGTHHHAPALVRDGAIPVELHHALHPRAPFDVDVDAVWRRAEEATIAGVRVAALSPDDLVIHLCVHAAFNHQFGVPLLHLCDLAATLARYAGRLDGRRLAAVANAAGVGRLVYATLRVTRELLAAEPPGGALDALAHDRRDEAIVAAIGDYVLLPDHDIPVAYRELRERDGAGAKLRWLLRALLPSPSELRRVYGLPPASGRVAAYYVVRALDLLRRRGRTMAGLLLRTPGHRPALEREERRLRIRRWLEGQDASAAAGRASSRSSLTAAWDAARR